MLNECEETHKKKRRRRLKTINKYCCSCSKINGCKTTNSYHKHGNVHHKHNFIPNYTYPISLKTAESQRRQSIQLNIFGGTIESQKFGDIIVEG